MRRGWRERWMLAGIALLLLVARPAAALVPECVAEVVRAAVHLAGRAVIPLRYGLRIEGLEEIRGRGRRGILFLPRHVANVDPLIVHNVLYPAFRARPVMIGTNANGRLRPVYDALGVVRIPDPTLQRPDDLAELERAITEIVEGLERGENFIFYPGGRIQRARFERLMGTSGVRRILARAPWARVVLLRMPGLYGSMTGRGRDDGNVDGGRLLRTVGAALLLNLVFFMPRRSVTLDFCEPGGDFPRADPRRLNAAIDRFYNERSPPPTHVPYFFWQGDRPVELPDPPYWPGLGAAPAESVGEARAAIHAHLRGLYAETGDELERLEDSLELGADLGFDSLDRLAINVWIEQRFRRRALDVDRLRTVGDLVYLAVAPATDRNVLVLP